MTFIVNALNFCTLSKTIRQTCFDPEFLGISSFPHTSLSILRSVVRRIKKKPFPFGCRFICACVHEPRNNSLQRKHSSENFIYRSKRQRWPREVSFHCFSLFFSFSFSFFLLLGPFRPTFAELMSWKDKGLRSGKRQKRGGVGVGRVVGDECR